MKRIRYSGRLSVSDIVLTLLFLCPVGAIVYIALNPAGLNLSNGSIITLVPSLLKTTLLLCVMVLGLSLPMGIITAWLVTFFKFPGRKFLRLALFMPFACPPYIIAFVYTDLFEYSGAVQQTLRYIFGWQSAADYWFPEVRSVYSAAVVLSAVFYPYLYMLARSSFAQIPAALIRSAMLSGYTGLNILLRVILPMSRTAIFAGSILILMETLSEYGTIEFFNVKTFTKAIYDIWLLEGNLPGAVSLSIGMIFVTFILILLERKSRFRMKFYASKVKTVEVAEKELPLKYGMCCSLFCFLPVFIGFVVPLLWIFHALLEQNMAQQMILNYSNLLDSLKVAIPAVIICAIAGIRIEYQAYSQKNQFSIFRQGLFSMTYALPGTVLAIGVMILFNSIDDLLFTVNIMVFSGGLFMVIFTYSIRFFYPMSGSLESAFGKISPMLDESAKLIGYGLWSRLFRVHLPLIKNSLMLMSLVVFADCIKELSAVLILRPFNFQTLSIRIFELVKNEQFYDAAPASLIIILIGMFASGLIGYLTERNRHVETR